MILGIIYPNKDRYTMKGENKGKLKIAKDEKIIMKDVNININFATYGWGSGLNYYLIEGSGKMIKTNKRLIYIRKINPFTRSRSWPYTRVASIQQNRAMKLMKKGIKEYFELDFNEIVGYIEGRFLWIYGLALYVLSNERSEGITKKEYYDIAFTERYKIIDDPMILNNELSKADIKRMRREEKEYKRNLEDENFNIIN